jgi:hypothetical protein
VTLAALAFMYERQQGEDEDNPSAERRIWKLIAYLGRYAHQPADVCLRLTLRQLSLLAESTAGILKDEMTPNRS